MDLRKVENLVAIKRRSVAQVHHGRHQFHSPDVEGLSFPLESERMNRCSSYENVHLSAMLCYGMKYHSHAFSNSIAFTVDRFYLINVLPRNFQFTNISDAIFEFRN